MLLWKNKPPSALEHSKADLPSLDPYLIKSDKKHAVIIICPGGGYDHLAEHEGTPVAKWLNSLGISALVLHYRIAPYSHPVPLMDVQRAIRIVRAFADQWHIDKNKIGILGFSAGGHLAASAATLFDYKTIDPVDDIDLESARPDLAVLCYPVITFGEFTHDGSRKNLLGENADKSLTDLLSLEKQVSADTPPAFLWHTADDGSVPVENSLLFAESMSKFKIPFELHIYQHGKHGLGLAKDEPDVAVWTEACELWLKRQNF